MTELKPANEMCVLARQVKDGQAVNEVIDILQKEIYERASQGEFFLATKSLFHLSHKQLESLVAKLKSLDYRFEVIGDSEYIRFHKIIWGLSSDMGC